MTRRPVPPASANREAPRALHHSLRAGVTLVAMLVACEAGRPKWESLSTAYLVRLDRQRAHADSASVDTLPLMMQFRLPDSVNNYIMHHGTSLVALDAPVCRVALADQVDRAVHIFTTDGRYIRSIYGGGRDDPLLPSPTSMAITRSGHVVVRNFTGETVEFDSSGKVVRKLNLHMDGDPREAAGIIAVDNQGNIYDHWIGSGFSVPRSNWPHDAPLVRLWQSNGHYLGQDGSLAVYPPHTFTQALNRGALAILADTLWFARSADGRILAFPLRRSMAVPLRVINLPLYYQMDAPREEEKDGLYFTSAARHILAFAAAPTGELFFIQSTSWTTDSLGVGHSHIVLASIERDGSHYHAYSVDQSAVKIAVTTTHVYTLARPGEEWEIMVYERRHDRSSIARATRCR